MQETQVQSLSCEDPMGKEMAAHSSILAWRIPWAEEPGGGYSPWGHKELDMTWQLDNSNKALNGGSFEIPGLGLPKVQSTSGFYSDQDWLVGRVDICFFFGPDFHHILFPAECPFNILYLTYI